MAKDSLGFTKLEFTILTGLGSAVLFILIMLLILNSRQTKIIDSYVLSDKIRIETALALRNPAILKTSAISVNTNPENADDHQARSCFLGENKCASAVCCEHHQIFQMVLLDPNDEQPSSARIGTFANPVCYNRNGEMFLKAAQPKDDCIFQVYGEIDPICPQEAQSCLRARSAVVKYTIEYSENAGSKAEAPPKTEYSSYVDLFE